VLTERGGIGRTEDVSRGKAGDLSPSQIIEMLIAGNDGKMREAKILECRHISKSIFRSHGIGKRLY
jgi:hypothetical protein